MNTTTTLSTRVISAYRVWKAGGSFADLECRLEDLANGTNFVARMPPAPLTCGQMATILGVSPRTANKIFDAGGIRGWKVNRDRRVCPVSLREYMEENGYPVQRLEAFLSQREAIPTKLNRERIRRLRGKAS